jgi:ADP-ribosylglycohydrolase
MYDLYDRILGCLVTAGMGDGIGAPTEAMSYAEILDKYGRIEDFVDGSTNLVALGNVPGEITDDASQMYEMAKAVIATKGWLTTEAAADALLEWTKNWPRYYPRNAGPTARFVLEKILEGEDPVAYAKMGGMYQRGTSNGAAMRVAAAGLCNPGDIDGALETAIIMTKVSHGTQHAYAGACAISCGIAAALKEDSTVHSVIKACVYGAKKGEKRGIEEARTASGARLIPKIMKAISIAYDSENMEHAERMLDEEMGTDSSAMTQAVAIAIGLFVAADGNCKKTILGGANVGGDTDTIACIAGMLAGAFEGYHALPNDWKQLFKEANPQLDLEWAAKELTDIAKEKYGKNAF